MCDRPKYYQSAWFSMPVNVNCILHVCACDFTILFKLQPNGSKTKFVRQQIFEGLFPGRDFLFLLVGVRWLTVSRAGRCGKKIKTQPKVKQNHIKASCDGLLVITNCFFHTEHECRQQKASSKRKLTVITLAVLCVGRYQQARYKEVGKTIHFVGYEFNKHSRIII